MGSKVNKHQHKSSRGLEKLSDRGVENEESGCVCVCFYGKKLDNPRFQNIYNDSLIYMNHETDKFPFCLLMCSDRTHQCA